MRGATDEDLPPRALPGISGLVPIGGRVLRGVSEPTGGPVAVKVLPAPFDRETRDVFDADRTRLGRLRHVPSILQVDDVDATEDGRPYLVSELCADSVGALLARGERLDAEEVTAVGSAAAAALAAAHGAGVLHGRVCPANLLVRASGQPVLSDFGPAIRRPAGDLDDLDDIAAPETLRDGTISVATDLYGLGATLYAALTGAPPFPGRVGEHPSERVLQVLREPAPPVDRELAPPELARLLAELLATDPAARPADAARVAGRFEEMLARRAPGAVPTEQAGLLAELEAYDPPAEESWLEEPEPAAHPEPVHPGPAPAAEAEAVREVSPVVRRWALAAKVAAGVVVAVSAVLLTRQIGSAPSLAAAPAPTPAPTAVDRDVDPARPAAVRLTSVKVVDRGRKVTLAWQGEPGMSYAVIVAVAGKGPPAAKLVNQATTRTFEIRPGQQYCFQVQGSFDGVRAVQSNATGINGATCEN